MKKFMKTLPTLTTPIHGEVLMMYLVTLTKSISATLFARREEGHVPIYFISRVLQGAELNYPALEKLILALVHAVRRLQRYFQAYTVAILTNSPIKQAPTKPEKSRGDSNKETPKDFLIEAPPEDNRKEVGRKANTKLEEMKPSCTWKLYIDEASSSDGSGAGLMLINLEVEARRSIEEKEVLQVKTKEEESWMTPIHEYLLSGLLAEDFKESKKVKIKAPQYKLIGGILYKKDIARIIQDCEKSKEQSAVRKRAEIGAIAAENAWPFSHWGVSIIGPLPTAPRGLKFLAIAIKHSMKWIEAKPLTIVNTRHIERFVCEYVVYRFGVPHIISSKDDKHFKEGIFADLYRGLKITQSFSPITEHMEIISIIEKQLIRRQQGWVDDLPQVLRNRSRIGINKWYQSITLRNFDLEDMEFEFANSNTTVKLPILKLGEYEIWVIRIKQYFQIQDYALWDVIENGNSWVSIPQTTQENGTSVTKMSVRVTTEEKTNKKNDVKARSLLLMALPNEHQLTFSQYNDAKTMFAAIETRFGGNEATKKTQKKLLKQYISSTNEVNTASPQVSTASPNDLEEIHEDDLEAMDLKWQLSLLSMRAKRYYQRTWEKFFINANDTAGYDKSKVECFNLHNMGHFARECGAPRSKEGQFKNQDNTKKQGNNEDTSSKAMLAIDGVGFDWSDMAEEQV
ncbi:ribonuclease H-like domain-containing protein [Tanacetum coccineum]